MSLGGITRKQKIYSEKISAARPHVQYSHLQGVNITSTFTMETHGSNSVIAAAALEHIDALFGYAMTLTRDRSEAEDLVQETYLRAVRAANQPAADGNLKAWLFVIMRNAWLNVIRHKHNGRRIFEFETDEPAPAVAT